MNNTPHIKNRTMNFYFVLYFYQKSKIEKEISE